MRNVAENAYLGILMSYPDYDEYWTEEQFKEFEVRTPVCMEEITFQIRRIDKIEKIQGMPPGYRELVEAM